MRSIIQSQLVMLFFLGIVILTIQSSTSSIVWKTDNIQFDSNMNHTAGSKTWKYNIHIKSNGPIYPVKTGHISFRFNISINNLPMVNAYTPCLRLTAPFQDYTDILGSTIVGRYPLSVGDDLPMSRVFAIEVQKYFENYLNSTTRGITGFSIKLTSKMSVTSVTATYLTSQCEKIRTIGLWHDPHRWDLNRVPSSADDVLLPTGTGVIQVTEDITVSSLHINDGTLLLQQSNCPIGWSADNRFDLA